jgi:hypothetical protein
MNLITQIHNSKKVACFIHSTNLNENKTEVLEHLINYLDNCAFFPRVDFVFINNIGLPINHMHFHNISTKIIVNNYSEDVSLFENCTLKLLHFFSTFNPDYKILYLHTKGVTHSKTSVFYENIRDWINLMLYSLVNHTDSCIQLLDNYDCIGVDYRYISSNPHHYSGNFWWANANYIKNLSLNILKNKYDAEWWILTKNPHFIDLHSSCLIRHYENSYKINQYKDIIINNIDYYKNSINIHRCKIINLYIANKGNGLTNQLNIITNCIFSIINNKLYNKTKHLIIIDSFNKDFEKMEYCDIDEILDINYINDYLTDYNIIIIPKNKVRFEISKVEYGITGVNTHDITDKIKELCLIKDKYFFMPKNQIKFNEINGDPVPGCVKEVYIYYKINDTTYFTSNVESGCWEATKIDLLNENNEKEYAIYSNTISLEAKKNLGLFNTIFKNLKFASSFYETFNSFRIKIDYYKKISCIHLRNEKDANAFWAIINKMVHSEYVEKLNNKYIYLINKYLNPSPDEILLILSSSIS